MTPLLRWLLSGRSLLMALGFALVIVGVVVGAALFAGSPGATLGADILPTPVPCDADAPSQRYRLAEGSTSREVAEQLEEIGVIRSASQFTVLVGLLGLQNRLATGVYTLHPCASTYAIISSLTIGEVVPTVRITFPEGLRVEEMAAIAEEAGLGSAEEFIAAASAVDLQLSLAVQLPEGAAFENYQYPEGYLFPDTYIVPLGSTAADLIALMAETLHIRFSAELREAAASRGLTPHEVLILASLIEREVSVPEERAVVAGVLFNRLEAFDRLGVDATVQYALASSDPASVEEFGWWKPGDELTFADLDIDSPYNTRRFVGLPPGPIANPGLAAIEAVVYAEDTEYYFYSVDTRRDDGSHCFAVTFDDHNNPNRCEKVDR